MPYKISGDAVINTETGKTKGHSSNPKKFLHTLLAIEHGWKPGKYMHKVAHKMRG